jgi:hypothetical protein
VYWQVIPASAEATQVAPMLCVVSHTLAHAPQLEVDVVELSQPLVFGAVLSQSCHPAAQSR